MRYVAWASLLALLGVGVFGWVFNIVAIARAETITGLVVLRIVGIFIAPLGAVLGWF
jgi:hypothetical protein